MPRENCAKMAERVVQMGRRDARCEIRDAGARCEIQFVELHALNKKIIFYSFSIAIKKSGIRFEMNRFEMKRHKTLKYTNFKNQSSPVSGIV